MDHPVKTASADVVASLASLTASKTRATSKLSSLVSLFNQHADRYGQALALSALVLQFNKITADCDALRAKVATMDAIAAAVSIACENLTDEQVETINANPYQYFAAGYLVVVNGLLRFGRDKGLELADKFHVDLRQDINDAYDDLAAGVKPDPPRVSIVFASDHALDIVLKALADAERLSEPTATP